MPTLSERIWALAAPPKSSRPSGSDADLLVNLRAGTADALAQLVTRHGPAVWRVCRARLSNGADVDDAFQATFLALAQSPNAVRNPDCLAAWLNGVAARVCLKLERHRRRHPAGPLTSDPVGKLTDPATEAERRELSAAVLDEVAKLPDKLRTVILLCSLGGQTSAETAGQLGVPVGTVESRLSTARARLKQRLQRRGIAAAGLTIVFADATATTAECARLLQLVCGPMGARATSQFVTTLATGVTTTMTTLKLLTMTLLVGGALGGVGYGLAGGTGEEPPAKGAKPDAEVKKPPAELVKPAELPTQFENPVDARIRLAGAEVRTRQLLAQPIDKLVSNLSGMNNDQLFAALEPTGLFVRFDYPEIYRLKLSTLDEVAISERKLSEIKVQVGPTRGMSVGNVLKTICVMIDPQLTYRVQGNQVLLAPGYQPAFVPGTVNRDPGAASVNPRYFAEAASGPPVSVAFDGVKLKDAITTLRQMTGANIVLGQLPADGPADIDATFDDVRLYTVLEVIGLSYGLEVVYMRNVYYVTTPERAMHLRHKLDEEMFGKTTDTQKQPDAKPMN